jgi:hypothetical protein
VRLKHLRLRTRNRDEKSGSQKKSAKSAHEELTDVRITKDSTGEAVFAPLIGRKK